MNVFCDDASVDYFDFVDEVMQAIREPELQKELELVLKGGVNKNE